MRGVQEVGTMAAYQAVTLEDVFQGAHRRAQDEFLDLAVVQVNHVDVVVLGLYIKDGLGGDHQFETLLVVVEADEGFLIGVRPS